MYRRNVLITHYRQFVLVVKSLLGGTLIITILMVIFNLQYFNHYGKELVLYFSLYSLVLLFFLRVVLGKIIFHFFIRKNLYPQRILVIGGEKAGKHVVTSLKRDKDSMIIIAGILDDYLEKGKNIIDEHNNLGAIDDLKEVVNSHEVSEILIAIDNAPYSRLIYIVEECLKTGLPVRIYSDFLNVVAEKMRVEYYVNIPLVVLSQYPLESNAWIDKRTMDIILASLALMMLSFVFLFVGIGIKLSSKGPIILKQRRIGKGGNKFNFYKFRSMYLHSDDSQHKKWARDFIEKGTGTDSTNIKVFKTIDDPRVFPFGRFIRKTSIDEFPQFLNVLKGDMSIVGPRPCLPYEWELYQDWHKNRLTVLPGCTGLWQTLGRSSVSFEEMVVLDLYYISNMSLWLDFKIIFNTFPVIFLGKGAY